MTDSPILSVSHLKKSFGEHEVLRDISFDVQQGDVVSIIGASGSARVRFYAASTFWSSPPPAPSSFRAKTPKPSGAAPSTTPRWAWCFRASICLAT